MNDLFNRITKAVEEIPHGWTSVPKAHTMAAVILALRPDVTVEIGVYAGKGIVAMGLAHKEIGKGIVIGIDPYSPTESSRGQVNPADMQFWGQLDHEMIYKMAQENIFKNGIQNSVRLERSTSDSYTPPSNIGMVRVDGNHGEQVLKDIERYCPNVNVGGVLFLDDIGWAGGSVQRASGRLLTSGWKLLYHIDDGVALQRVK